MKEKIAAGWTRAVQWIKKQYRQWRDVVWTTGFDIVLQASNAATGILTARLLLPEGKGELTAAILWPSLFQAVGSLGVKDAATYFTGKGKYPFGTLYGSLLGISLVQGTLIAVAGWFLIPVLLSDYSPQAILAAKIIVCASPLSLLGGYSMGILQGRGRFDFWNSLRMLRRVSYLGGVALLYAVSMVSVLNVTWGYLLASVLVTGVVPIGALLWPQESISASWGAVNDILNYGAKNWVGSLTDRANSKADQALLSTFLAPQYLGWYRVAASAAALVGLVGMGFKRVIFATTSQANYHNSKAEIGRYLKTALVPVLLSSVAFVGAIPFLLPLVFGSEYSNAILTAQILGGAMIFKSMKGILYNGVRGQGRPEWVFYGEAVGLIVTIVLLYLLLEPYDIEGAAVASLCAYVSGLSATLYIHKNDGVLSDETT